MTRAEAAFRQWRTVPAPARGALVKRFGELLAEHKEDLATLVSLEAGKITSEARGEVQEMIDICDFAVGLSRQLYGATMPSERPGHRLMETWHPLGVVGVISAFNFPAAVWSWNTAIALVCGDPVVWKPSELTPLTSLACQAVLARAIAEPARPTPSRRWSSAVPRSGPALVDHPGIALLSATGSTRMGRAVGPRVAERFGRSLLELGGNNAAVVAPSADLDLAVRGIVFSAAGTAGQRCTTMRRVIAHTTRDRRADRPAGLGLRPAADRQPDGRRHPGRPARQHGGRTRRCRARSSRPPERAASSSSGGGRELEDESRPTPTTPGRPSCGSTSRPTWSRQETFAPLLYVLPYDDFEEAIALNNAVPQGLSSSVFTSDLAEAELFLSPPRAPTAASSTSTSAPPARRSAARSAARRRPAAAASPVSDAWRAYMRRATNTVNYSGELPLAQGVDFTV